ncbi:MAG: phosphoserine phosphatase RsbU/P [Actinomycetota bacterium]|nr:phosphoserine phosphatase RsbU/P [Actinomycetota bacterium]
MSGEAALDEFYDALLDDDAESLYERAPCGYLSTTPTGTIVKVNQTFLTWTGYEREALVGQRRFSELLTVGGRIYHETHYLPMLQMQGRAREIALEIVGADGERLPALVNSVLERDAEGRPVVIRTAVFDATDRREYERELLRAKQRAEASEEHAKLLARTLQETLIPPAPPRIAGLDVAAAFRPAGNGEEIGGDFYDIFELGPDEWMIVLGDVQGKGVGAAVVAALTRFTIRAEAVRLRTPAAVLQSANEVLLNHETERFCSVVLLRLHREPAGWTLTVSSAGHPLPLLRRPGSLPESLGQSDLLLGVFGAATFRDREYRLETSDVVLAYTDGVTEARRGDEWLGEAGLLPFLTRTDQSAAGLTQAVLQHVLDFQSGFPRDDIAIVSLVVPASPT